MSKVYIVRYADGEIVYEGDNIDGAESVVSQCLDDAGVGGDWKVHVDKTDNTSRYIMYSDRAQMHMDVVSLETKEV
jgi:hypothetical protein